MSVTLIELFFRKISAPLFDLFRFLQQSNRVAAEHASVERVLFTAYVDVRVRM